MAAARAEQDPFRLRELPHDGIYFYSKRIDNSRLRAMSPLFMARYEGA